jgi:hypothetical protein
MVRDILTRLTLTDPPIRRLGMHAFHRVLSQKPTLYAGILERLADAMKESRYCKFALRMGRLVVYEGFRELRNVRF